MCVIFWAEEGAFEVSHVFEVLRFEPHRGRALANVSVIISNPYKEKVTVGAVHRRAVNIEPALWRWQTHSGEEQDWIVSIVSRLYESSFEMKEQMIIKFDREKMRGGSYEVSLAGKQTRFQRIIMQNECRNSMYITERTRPFTPFVFGPLGPKTTWLYSFDITIEGKAFAPSVAEERSCTIDGAAILRGKILNEDLAAYDEGSPWKRYFLERICARIVKPLRYDTMITNGIGTLPICYRLCNRTHREFIKDENLNKRVAWFTSDDPNQDFIIELEFANEKTVKEPTASNTEH